MNKTMIEAAAKAIWLSQHPGPPARWEGLSLRSTRKYSDQAVLVMRGLGMNQVSETVERVASALVDELSLSNDVEEMTLQGGRIYFHGSVLQDALARAAIAAAITKASDTTIPGVAVEVVAKAIWEAQHPGPPGRWERLNATSKAKALHVADFVAEAARGTAGASLER